MISNIFDSHVHIFSPARLRGLLMWAHEIINDFPLPVTTDEETIVKTIHRTGTTRYFNLIYPLREKETIKLNTWNLDFCQKHSEAVPVGSLHIDTPDKTAYARYLFKAGCYGIKFHPFVQKFNPHDPTFDALYAAMNEMQMPLFLHTGYDSWYGDTFPLRHIEKIIKHNPGMPVILVHMLFPLIQDAYALCDNYENVILDATNIPGSFPYMKRNNMPVPADLIDTFITGLEKYSSRTMLGSDFPVGFGTYSQVIADLRSLGVTDQAIADLTWNTADKLHSTITKIQALI